MERFPGDREAKDRANDDERDAAAYCHGDCHLLKLLQNFYDASEIRATYPPAQVISLLARTDCAD